ncbi:cobalt-precorrin 5A hydrolase [Mitsuokella sp.]|uniref:cobalt-precorrin 5A hydrolase n=1 Tax=unclassified Mitsuokella TaxID=2637239 RepID=UPI003D7EEA71
MRTAVFALTAQGTLAARRVCLALGTEADLFVSKRHPLAGASCFEKLQTAVAENFSRYEALVFIMAAGIVVRTLAPYLKSKLEDPAVLVLDERTEYVISLLSGHVGGANDLARRLAMALDAEAVITTATDVEGIPAPDALAGRLGLFPEPHEEIRIINSALLEGRIPSYYIDPACPLTAFYEQELRRQGILPEDISLAEQREENLQVIISGEEKWRRRTGRLFLRPLRLIAGLGCRKNTTAAEIQKALTEAVQRIGLPLQAVTAIASTVFKEREQGLQETAAKLGLPLLFYDNDALNTIIYRYGLQKSAFVQKTIGVGNVCEAAALAAAGSGRLALGKTRFEKVTVALVWQKKQKSR